MPASTQSPIRTNPNGQAASADSQPVVLSTGQEAKIDLLAKDSKLDAIITALGNLLTELNAKTEPANTQVVSAAALPLPTGAGTSANQSTIITALGNLLTELQQKTEPTQTQPVSAVALPLPTGAATDAKLDTVITSLGSLLTELGQKTEPTQTQPISAVALPLPAGAAADSTLATIVTALGNLLTELQAKTEPANVQQVSLPDAAQTGSGALRIGSTKTKFFEGFGAWPNLTVWDESVGINDVNLPLGNCAGVSYLGIIKSVGTTDTITEIVSKVSISTPWEGFFGLSISNNIQGQIATLDLVGVGDNGVIEADALPASMTITSITVVSNVVTVAVSAPHPLKVGNIVALSGNLDSRFNQGPIAVVNTLAPNTFTFPYTIADGTYSAGGLGVVDLVCPCVGAHNSVGVALMEVTDDNVRYFMRGSAGPVFVSGAVSLGTDWRTAVIPSGYDVYGMDALNARARLFMRYRQEDFLVQTRTNDSQSTPLNGGYDRSQNLPDPRKEYKLRARMTNLKNLTRPVARITSISKAGSTTTTVTLDVSCAAAGIVTGKYVSIPGVPDQTNFVLTNNALATVTGANTFTCVIAGTGTATVTTGGSVFICEGSQSAPVLAQAINSISRTGNVLTAIGNTTWSGMVRGEWYTLHGMGGSATQYEGTYRLINASTTSLVFESVGADFGSITTGGSVIENTIFRLHQLCVLDLTRLKAEISSGPGTNIDMDAVSVRGTVTAASSGDYQCIGKAAHDAAQSGNPVRGAYRARSSHYTAVANDDVTEVLTDLNGRQIVQLGGFPQVQDYDRVTLTTATETTLSAQVANVRKGQHAIEVANRDTVPHTIDLRETTGGTIRRTWIIPAGESLPLSWPAGLWPAAVNTNWTVQMREVTTTNAVEISSQSYRIGY